jgi:RNA polymerase sigma-70 factor (ECF subfamily)
MHAGILRLSHVLSSSAGAPVVSRRSRIEPTESDGELVRRARRGDKWAEEALYHRYVRPVTRVVMRLLARSTEAEDAVQDTFVNALGDLGKLRDEDAFGSWLLRVAVRQVHRRYRRRRLLRALGLDRGEDDAALSDQLDPRSGPEVRAGLAEIDRLLATLPSRSRIAWMLRHPMEAVDPLERLVAVYPSSSRASLAALTLGRIELTLGRATKAGAAFERALALGVPAGLEEDVRARLVEAYVKTGNRDAAQGAARDYERRFPAGRRTADIAHWLAR